ncbi:DUF91 domain-containing protein [Chroococcidiopsis sp. CCALA 051]|nr:DUF91 domain-containing protein [Chroococcidiopsis sp. CCALA 051]
MLRKSGLGFEFESELALEEFVWSRLNELLELTPLKRQYYVNNEICDILATSNDRQLTIIELKNSEDRYIVHQLTRYYDGIQYEKPFSQQINYNQKINLIAIAPSFHKHNFIDRKYNTLFIQFLKYSIVIKNETYYLQLKDIDNSIVRQIIIPYNSVETSQKRINSPSRAFLNLLSDCSNDNRNIILKLREKILSFHPRVRETVSTGIASYGNGKSKSCIEIATKNVHSFRFGGKRTRLFLKLPLLPPDKRKANFWMWVETEDWINVSSIRLSSVVDGYDFLAYTWLIQNPNKIMYFKTYYTVDFIQKRTNVIIQENSHFEVSPVEYLVNIALEKWIEKI